MAEATLLDTGVLVALANRADPDHARCVEALQGVRGGLVSVEGILVEACFLLRRARAPERAIELTLALGVRFLPPTPASLRRTAEYLHKYQSRAIDLVDAQLCVAAEQLQLRRILTLDRRDFSIYRLRGNRALQVLPVIS